MHAKHIWLFLVKFKCDNVQKAIKRTQMLTLSQGQLCNTINFYSNICKKLDITNTVCEKGTVKFGFSSALSIIQLIKFNLGMRFGVSMYSVIYSLTNYLCDVEDMRFCTHGRKRMFINFCLGEGRVKKLFKSWWTFWIR